MPFPQYEFQLYFSNCECILFMQRRIYVAGLNCLKIIAVCQNFASINDFNLLFPKGCFPVSQNMYAGDCHCSIWTLIISILYHWCNSQHRIVRRADEFTWNGQMSTYDKTSIKRCKVLHSLDAWIPERECHVKRRQRPEGQFVIGQEGLKKGARSRRA